MPDPVLSPPDDPTLQGATLDPAAFAQVIRQQHPKVQRANGQVVDSSTIPDDVLVKAQLAMQPELRGRVFSSERAAGPGPPPPPRTNLANLPKDIPSQADLAYREAHPYTYRDKDTDVLSTLSSMVPSFRGITEAPGDIEKIISGNVSEGLVGKPEQYEASQQQYNAMLQSHVDELKKARDAWQSGEHVEAAGHAAAGALPMFGPPAAKAGEDIGTGAPIKGATEATGMLAPFALGKLSESAAESLPKPEPVIEGGPPLPAGATGFTRDLLRNTVTGRAIRDKYGEPLLKEAEEHITKHFGDKIADEKAIAREAEDHVLEVIDQTKTRLKNLGNVGAQEGGTAAQTGIKAGAKIGAKRAEELYAPVDAAAQDAKVNIAPLKDEITRMAEAGDPLALSLQSRVVGKSNPLEGMSADELRAHIQKTAKAADITGGEGSWRNLGGESASGMPDEVSWNDARALQRELAGQVKSPWQTLSQDIKGGAAKHLWENLTSSMKEGLDAAVPGAAEDFEKASNYYREYSGLFKRGTAAAAAKAVPEDVIAGKLTPTRIDRLRDAVVGYAERYGTPEELSEGKAAWEQVQRAFVKQRTTTRAFGEGDLKALVSDLNKNNDTWETMFKDNPEALRNLRSMATTYEDLAMKPNFRKELEFNAIQELQTQEAAAREKLGATLPATTQGGSGVGGMSTRALMMTTMGTTASILHSLFGGGSGSWGSYFPAAAGAVYAGTEGASGLISWLAYKPEMAVAFNRAMVLAQEGGAAAGAKQIVAITQQYEKERTDQAGPPAPQAAP